MKKLLLIAGLLMLASAASADKLPPWVMKESSELTHDECLGAMKHDSSYFWSKGVCHIKFIRYAAGVVINDTKAFQNPDAVLKKGEIVSITQHFTKDDLYCGHGSPCYPAKDIKLLASALNDPDGDVKNEDTIQYVNTSCEMILADKAEIIAAGARSLLRDCH